MSGGDGDGNGDGDDQTLLIDTAQFALSRELTQKTRLGTQTNLQTLRVQRLLLFMIYGLLTGAACWLIGSIFVARKMYAHAAALIDQARAAKLYDGPSGTRTVFAFHLGRFGAFICGFPNADLPAALVVMCYEERWYSVFDSQGSTSRATLDTLTQQPGNDMTATKSNAPGPGILRWFQCIHKIGMENTSFSATQIICTALDCNRGASSYGCPQNTLCPNVISCLPSCNPTKYVQTDVKSMTAMQGINGAISTAGAFALAGSSILGPISGIVCGLVGAIFGGTLGAAAAIERSKALHKMCVDIRMSCVAVPNMPPCGGYQ